MLVTSPKDMIRAGEDLARQILVNTCNQDCHPEVNVQEKLLPIISLSGELGVGKTTFTKGVGKALDIQERIVSPSFTLAKSYVGSFEGRTITLLHIDAYRLVTSGLDAKAALAELEVTDILDNDIATFIVLEWGESFVDKLNREIVRVNIEYTDVNIDITDNRSLHILFTK